MLVWLRMKLAGSLLLKRGRGMLMLTNGDNSVEEECVKRARAKVAVTESIVVVCANMAEEAGLPMPPKSK